MRSEKIRELLLILEPFILITYTTKFGETPLSTSNFLLENYINLKGVISSGNKNWSDNYGKAADTISKQYNVPLIHKFELRGNKKDIEIVIAEVSKFDKPSS